MKRTLNFYSYRLFIVFIFFIQSCHFNKSSNEPTDKEQTLRLGVNNWYFWRSNKNGQFKGADVDIWNEIAKRNDLFIEYVAISDLQHLERAMNTDSIDAFVSMRKNPEREKYMDFVEPPFRTKVKYLTYIKSKSNIEVNQLEDMHGLKIALIGGNYDLIDNDTLIEKKIISWDVAKGFDYLLNDSIAVVHAMQWLAERFLRDEKYNSQIKLTPYTYSEYHSCYMVMSKKSALTPKWEKVFGQTIQKMIDDGTMKKIIDSYVPGWYETYTPGWHE